ncbi:MAG: ribonuclease HII [Nitrosarchaeum sp.]|nr:ribonuclease HII [Nitrosarchaeum sp.]
MLTIGIDEAGRGPVMGPLVMAAVALTSTEEKNLKKQGVRDSKLLTPEERERLFTLITPHPHAIISVSPADIDAAVISSTTNLNWLEADTASQLIQELAQRCTIQKIIIDSPTRNTDAFRDYVQRKLGDTPYTLICKNKADFLHPVVGAASILAKVTRDREITKLHAKAGIAFGSGYLTDPLTQEALRMHHKSKKLRGILRESWAPVRDLRQGTQTTLLTGSEEHLYAPLTAHGFTYLPATNPYETVRMKGPGSHTHQIHDWKTRPARRESSGCSHARTARKTQAPYRLNGNSSSIFTHAHIRPTRTTHASDNTYAFTRHPKRPPHRERNKYTPSNSNLYKRTWARRDTESTPMTRITRLEMKGFKSFAQKVEIALGTGFNCVLGPNGSGKSNIMDALCFVLGKSSAKGLRAEKSANLIYNGGKKKSPAKEGSVTIAFLNQDNIFGDFGDELRVTRIIKPSGQSTYKINDKVHTRQQIIDVLSRARIDPDGHNVVLQGDIVRMAEMSPEERRKVIEEIAGINIYEDKKEKALRELARVEEKLNEAHIILTERETYLKELKAERDQAARFKELDTKVRRNKATLIDIKKDKKHAELTKYLEKSADHQAKIKNYEEEIRKLRTSIEAYKKEVEAINKEVEAKGEKEQVQMHKQVEQLRIGHGPRPPASRNPEARALQSRGTQITAPQDQRGPRRKDQDPRAEQEGKGSEHQIQGSGDRQPRETHRRVQEKTQHERCCRHRPAHHGAGQASGTNPGKSSETSRRAANTPTRQGPYRCPTRRYRRADQQSEGSRDCAQGPAPGTQDQEGHLQEHHPGPLQKPQRKQQHRSPTQQRKGQATQQTRRTQQATGAHSNPTGERRRKSRCPENPRAERQDQRNIWYRSRTGKRQAQRGARTRSRCRGPHERHHRRKRHRGGAMHHVP